MEAIDRGSSNILMRVSSQKHDGVWFTIATNSDGKLVACAFSEESQRRAEREIKRSIRDRRLEVDNGNRVPQTEFDRLFELFDGKGRIDWSSLDLPRVSDFRRKVYVHLHNIPRGHVTTYGAIAKKLGGKRYARAVGTAVATNPLPLVIPCHRVLPSSLKVGNYGMPGRKPSDGGHVKRTLLEREGVRFQGDKVSSESLWEAG